MPIELPSSPFHQPGIDRLSELKIETGTESISSDINDIRGSALDLLKTEETESEELHILNRIANLIYFGNGKHWWIGIVLQALLLSICINFVFRCHWASPDDTKESRCFNVDSILKNNLAVICFCLIIEQAANLLFGYSFTKNGGFTEVMEIAANVANPERRLILKKKWRKWLLYLLVLAITMGYLNLVVQTVYLSDWNTNEVTDDNFGSDYRGLYVYSLSVQYIYFTMNYYCCGIWIWVVIVHHDYWKEEMEPLLCEEKICHPETNKTIFKFFEKIDEQSTVWSANHIVRSVTGVIICLGNMSMMYYDIEHMGEGDNSHIAIQHASFVFTYYLSVWATFLVAGYANDDMQHRAKHLLGTMMMNTSSADVKMEAQHSVHSLEYISTGYRVGGLVMHLEKAISVGSIIMYAIIAITKLHSEVPAGR